MNQVKVTGRVVGVPTAKKFKNGKIVVFSIVVNEKFTTKNGEEKENSYFFDVEVIGPAASTLTLNKGDLVLVEGSLRQDRWETPSGEKRSKVKIVAFKVVTQSKPAN